jgi:hypothetical protein
MERSAAGTVATYLVALPAERREAISSLRQLILQRLPPGFEECMEFGMINYVVPLSRYPKTYNGKPLSLAALASQKQYMSLYLMAVYGDPEAERGLSEGFRRAGKRLDMGKSCLRFRSLADLPLDVVGDALARVSVDQYIALYERAGGQSGGAAARLRRTKKAASMRPAKKRTLGARKKAAGKAPGAKKKASPRVRAKG